MERSTSQKLLSCNFPAQIGNCCGLHAAIWKDYAIEGLIKRSDATALLAYYISVLGGTNPGAYLPPTSDSKVSDFQNGQVGVLREAGYEYMGNKFTHIYLVSRASTTSTPSVYSYTVHDPNDPSRTQEKTLHTNKADFLGTIPEIKPGIGILNEEETRTLFGLIEEVREARKAGSAAKEEASLKCKDFNKKLIANLKTGPKKE